MKDQGETISVFTLMISEIANQKVKISSTAKTGDKSDFSLTVNFDFSWLITVTH